MINQKNEIQSRLTNLLSEMLKIPSEKISLSSKLSEDLGVDSLDFFDVVVRISESFDIKIENSEELPPFVEVRDVVDFISEKLMQR